MRPAALAGDLIRHAVAVGDLAIEIDDRLPWVEAEVGRQAAAVVLEHAQRLALASDGVQRPHQQQVRALA